MVATPSSVILVNRMSAEGPDLESLVERKHVPPPLISDASRSEEELPSPRMRARRVLRAMFAALLVGLGLWMARSYLVAVVWAIVIAIAIWPAYRRFQHRIR